MKVIQITQLSFEQYQSDIKELKSLIKENNQGALKVIDEEVYYSRKYLASKFDVELSTIHNWCKKGYLKPHGIGNRVYFKKSEVDEALTPLKR
jgi:Zn-dependent oligopeptidase